MSCPTANSASHVKHWFNIGKHGGGEGISRPQVFSLPLLEIPEVGLGGGTGMSSLGLGLYRVYLLLEGIFLSSSLFVFGLERNSGARSQRYQKAVADPKNPATGDLLPNTALSQNEMVGVLLHLLSYLKSFLCKHTIFQLQSTETVNKALIPSKMDGKGWGA